MSRYIDAELLLQKLSRMIDYCEKNKDKKFNALNVLFQVGDAIIDCPTADVVEVVRCKDCRFGTLRYGAIKCTVDEDESGFILYHERQHYCGYGERREP